MSANTGSLSEYLEQLPGTTFRRLYQQPSTTFAIFRRMLPKLAKTIVMAMLYMQAPFPIAELDAWVKPSAKRQKDQAISILRSLHILQRDASPTLSLSPNFRTSLQLVLEGGGDHNSFGVPSTQPVAVEIDPAFLDRYAQKKWDDILHFVVNSVGFSSGPGDRTSNGPKQSVKDLMIRGHLVERRGGSGINITQAGFTFLLQEANAQVWTLLLLWLESADAVASVKGADEALREGLDSVDMLTFFFLLASLELGRAYDTDALTEARRNMLPNLVDFGLVYVPPANAQQFFPTRLATTLTSSNTAPRSVSAAFTAAATVNPTLSTAEGGGSISSADPGQDKSAIILETNFRLYAYVNSPLQIAVLALFVDLKYRFRGLVSGVLTRASIRRAVDMGITSDQIISYLATHAHEQMHRVASSQRRPVLPPVVVDQIRLWQLDTERMLATSGFLFKDFEDYKEYSEICNFADDIGVVTWRNDRKGMFFASKVDQIKDFMRTRKKANESK
ncbi:putative RNA polymerase II transcription factor B subunit 2 [Rosellinia necatrix]|uniref:RNA polymerase II transcription factor B subunit 2 n=1 Tax=Rosellinia necatrix TaxID=77044 RepID=A0A1W2TM56_ROSNE|nr:putative RNA polymerase II transcription factor B subunit 2 [Rosellinia necatrix]